MAINKPHLAIIGAGISGLTCASLLQNSSNFQVSVFDKSRGVGGRMSTRRVKDFEFDHGFQQSTPPPTEHNKLFKPWGDLMVPSPKANILCKELAQNIQIYTSTEIVALNRIGSQWELSSKDNNIHSPFDAIILTAPPLQTHNLLPANSTFKHKILEAKMSPCFALMVGYPTLLHTPWNYLKDLSAEISWVGHNSTKPDRPHAPSTFIVHSTSLWAQEKLEQDLSQTQTELLDLFWKQTRIPQATDSWVQLHRWRYALTQTPLGLPHLWDPQNRIGVCGDWLLGNDIHAAITSAHSLAAQIGASFTTAP